MQYLLHSDLLSNKQYGYVKGRPTVLQLLKMIDSWTECLEKRIRLLFVVGGGVTIVIYSLLLNAVLILAIKPRPCLQEIHQRLYGCTNCSVYI